MSDATTTRRRQMRCCVCSADAGLFKQHWNRDNGFGICRPCVEKEATLMSPATLQKNYGIEGVNYASREKE